MAYAGRLAIITGGLGGLGSATGKLLLAQGARLAILHAPFETDQAQSIVSSTFSTEHHSRISTHPCDVTDPASVSSAFDQLSASPTDAFPSVLITSAGYVALHPLEDTPPEVAARSLNINLLGSLFPSQAFVKLYLRMKAERLSASSTSSAATAAAPAPGGRIVCISSQAGHVALPQHGAYCASKAGLMGLVRSMALEWGPKGITANTVSPTVVWTTLGKQAWADVTVRETFQAKIPTGRFATPEEVASSIEYLCRDEAAMVNGADVRVDGGFTIA